MEAIDLRSDTVTKPSPAMREAMYRAEVGDDGYYDDPTVNRLQEIVAERVGKEDSLLMPSGCMANLVGLLTNCTRQGEVILGDSTDMYIWECGAMSVVGGLYPHPLPNQLNGTIGLGEIEAAIRCEDVHFPRTQLICIENTNNVCGGVPLTSEYTASVSALAKRHKLRLYLDGARVFNSAVAQGIDVRELTKDVDSLQFCLSKGLGCPVGSMLCGSKDFVYEARRNRKMLGGQMRQAGIIAAAGIVAMEQMVDRLAEDHQNAHVLAADLSEIKGLTIKPENVQTNIIYLQLTGRDKMHEELVARLDKEGVKVIVMGAWIRAVTHYGITEQDVKAAAAVIGRVVGAM